MKYLFRLLNPLFLSCVQMTVNEISSGKLIVKKSKFYAHLYEIDSSADIDEIKEIHDKLYRKANHHCYAVIYNGKQEQKADGEVGSPGKVLLDLLKNKNLDNHMLMVSRIFGGIKLGPGGVSRAFREVGLGVINLYLEK